MCRSQAHGLLPGLVSHAETAVSLYCTSAVAYDWCKRMIMIMELAFMNL